MMGALMSAMMWNPTTAATMTTLVEATRRLTLSRLGREVIAAANNLDEDELVDLAARIAAAAIPALDGRPLAAHRIGQALCAAIRKEETK